MTPALEWAVMRAILMFYNCEGQNHKAVSTNHNFWRERRAEVEFSWGPAYQPNALLLDQTRSLAPEGFKHQIYMASQGLQALGNSIR